jgi:hypothetical protein
MGISWEYPGCEDAAGSRPSKNPWGFWGFPIICRPRRIWTIHIPGRSQQPWGKRLDVEHHQYREFIQTYYQWAIFHIYANVYPKAKHYCFHHLSLTT